MSGEGRVARVAVDVPLAHLDRPFDYAIPDELAPRARAGVRCRVRFAGRQVDGYLLERVDTSEVDGRLAPLLAVPSDEVVLTPAIAGLVRAVATRWGGTFADVVRLAVPPRRAVAESAERTERPAPRLDGPRRAVLAAYAGAAPFLTGLAAGDPIRAAWSPVPVADDPGDWAGGLVEAAHATLSAGRGVLLLVPDADALAHLARRCEETFGEASFVTLAADLGPSARYRHFLAVARGDVRLVLGTRAAVFAPVHQLGLVAIWDEGNESYAEPHAPYPHAREVAALRASRESAGLLIAGYGRSAETQALLERGWLGPIEQEPRAVRRQGPAVRVTADYDGALERDPDARVARLPHEVFTLMRTALTSGPVLVQVPRAGYAPRLTCQGCREPVRCPRCGQPLRGERGPGGLELVCGACGPLLTPWRCPLCGDARLRVPRAGVTRTAEELGRAFPLVSVVQSWAGRRVEEVADAPALVLATPGAEPRAAGGYAGAVLLDTDVVLARPDLRAAEEALRRWLSVCALVRPASAGGTVCVVGEPASRAIQALVRLDAPGFAARELAERRETGFPPARRLVLVEGTADALESLGRPWEGMAGVEAFGPVPLPAASLPGAADALEASRITLRADPAVGGDLVAALVRAQGVRAARKASGALRVRVDPYEIG